MADTSRNFKPPRVLRLLAMRHDRRARPTRLAFVDVLEQRVFLTVNSLFADFATPDFGSLKDDAITERLPVIDDFEWDAADLSVIDAEVFQSNDLEAWFLENSTPELTEAPAIFAVAIDTDEAFDREPTEQELTALLEAIVSRPTELNSSDRLDSADQAPTEADSLAGFHEFAPSSSEALPEQHLLDGFDELESGPVEHPLSEIEFQVVSNTGLDDEANRELERIINDNFPAFADGDATAAEHLGAEISALFATNGVEPAELTLTPHVGVQTTSESDSHPETSTVSNNQHHDNEQRSADHEEQPASSDSVTHDNVSNPVEAPQISQADASPPPPLFRSEPTRDLPPNVVEESNRSTRFKVRSEQRRPEPVVRLLAPERGGGTPDVSDVDQVEPEANTLDEEIAEVVNAIVNNSEFTVPRSTPVAVQYSALGEGRIRFAGLDGTPAQRDDGDPNVEVVESEVRAGFTPWIVGAGAIGVSIRSLRQARLRRSRSESNRDLGPDFSGPTID